MKIKNVWFLRTTCNIKILVLNRNLSLVNKSWSTPLEMTELELKSLLHTAIEFRNSVINAEGKGIKIPDLHRKSVTLLLRSSDELLQAPYHSAGRFLSIPAHTIILPNWDKSDHVLDTRKIFEKHTDCLLCETQYISKSHKIIYDSPIPVVFTRSGNYMIILGLAQLMTIYLKFGRLAGLNVLWVGPPCATLNGLLAFSSTLCINFKYCCGFNTSAPASPSCLDNVMQQCSLKAKSSFTCQECTMENFTAIADGADVIVTTRQADSSLKVTIDLIKAAKSHSIILHTLHRGKSDMDEEIFQHENCLVWEVVANMKWIFAALMVRLMTEYEHTTPEPAINCQK